MLGVGSAGVLVLAQNTRLPYNFGGEYRYNMDSCER